MLEKEYRTQGTCSREIYIRMDDNGIIREVDFEGGCPGNLDGISKLVKDRPAQEVADLLRGMPCGPRPTSCPDQLSRALDELLVDLKQKQHR